MAKVNWAFSTFEGLTARELYAILKLRQEIFIIEQNCIYPDIDGWDQKSYHLMGWDTDRQLATYARIIPPGVKGEEASIGRIITREDMRGSGFGKDVVRKSIAKIVQFFPNQPIKIQAQHYLERFYAEFGFKTISEKPYEWDGIDHVDMLLTPSDSV